MESESESEEKETFLILPNSDPLKPQTRLITPFFIIFTRNAPYISDSDSVSDSIAGVNQALQKYKCT